MTRSAFALSALLLASCASGGASRGAPTTQPFSAENARFFDDAVDYIENPEDLGGRLAADWRMQIDHLARESELIVPVRIETVSEGTEANSAAAYTLTAVATGPAVKGQVPRDRHVALRVTEGSTGFHTVRNNITRVQAREYLLFARYQTDDEGQVRARWHLSPNTPRLLERVRDAVGYSDPSANERVIQSQPSS
jgi:hypothetical protein